MTAAMFDMFNMLNPSLSLDRKSHVQYVQYVQSLWGLGPPPLSPLPGLQGCAKTPEGLNILGRCHVQYLVQEGLNILNMRGG
eukprot:1818007-Amphidinium_carterae.1